MSLCTSAPLHHPLRRPLRPGGRRDHACQSDYIATVDNIAGFPFIIDAKDPATQPVQNTESSLLVAPQLGSPRLLGRNHRVALRTQQESPSRSVFHEGLWRHHQRTPTLEVCAFQQATSSLGRYMNHADMTAASFDAGTTRATPTLTLTLTLTLTPTPTLTLTPTHFTYCRRGGRQGGRQGGRRVRRHDARADEQRCR